MIVLIMFLLGCGWLYWLFIYLPKSKPPKPPKPMSQEEALKEIEKKERSIERWKKFDKTKFVRWADDIAKKSEKRPGMKILMFLGGLTAFIGFLYIVYFPGATRIRIVLAPLLLVDRADMPGVGAVMLVVGVIILIIAIALAKRR